MILDISRRLTGRNRNENANRHLGFILAFVAGAINAGGFLAVAQYTSHMTGIVSAMADDIALGAYRPALAGLCSLAAFTGGAACTAFLVNYARRQGMHSIYAGPLILEAGLLMGFGLLATQLATTGAIFVFTTILMLCFTMGLQNAVITKVSGAVIRTTHVSGIVTDIGIELGKLMYRSTVNESGLAPVMADRARLRMLASLLVLFFLGGVAGAIGFKVVGYGAAIGLACVLVFITIGPIADDIISRLDGPKL